MRGNRMIGAKLHVWLISLPDICLADIDLACRTGRLRESRR